MPLAQIVPAAVLDAHVAVCVRDLMAFLVCASSACSAGLTLTVADTAFIMEPALNPGLEAQAAARIYRLGEQVLKLVDVMRASCLAGLTPVCT